jgi:hypothetical protein
VAGAGRDHEEVIIKRRPVRQENAPLVGIHAGDLREENARLLLTLDDGADRCGDVGRRQSRGRYLVE